MKRRYLLIIDFISFSFYAWFLMICKFSFHFPNLNFLRQFYWSDNIILNFTPIFALGAFLYAFLLSAIRFYLTDRKHLSLDLAIIFLTLYSIIMFLPWGRGRIGFIEFLIFLFMPFMSWLGTLTWAIILLIYRIYLWIQESLSKG